MLYSTSSRIRCIGSGLILCCWLAACGAEAGSVVDGVWQPADEPLSAIQTPAAQVVHASQAADDIAAVQPRDARTPDASTRPHPAEAIIEPDAPASALAAAVTLDITNDPAQPSPWPEAHVRCEGMRIAPSVILTAAHCFAWHRGADSDAPPLAQVRVRSARAPNSAPEDIPGALALHVAIHPHYPALACSQPSRSAAAACLRAASRCVSVHGRDSQRRSACLQGVSEQVIEAQQHASYDLALVFVAPLTPQDVRLPCAVLAREPLHKPQGEVWLSPIGAADDPWHVDDTPGSHKDAFQRQPAFATRTSFDLWPAPAQDTRVFDGAFARAPASGARPQLVAWASRGVFEHAAEHRGQAVRYTRLTPHLIWLADTLVSVARVYPALSLHPLDIIDVGADTGLEDALGYKAFALSAQKSL